MTTIKLNRAGTESNEVEILTSAGVGTTFAFNDFTGGFPSNGFSVVLPDLASSSGDIGDEDTASFQYTGPGETITEINATHNSAVDVLMQVKIYPIYGDYATVIKYPFTMPAAGGAVTVSIPVPSGGGVQLHLINADISTLTDIVATATIAAGAAFADTQWSKNEAQIIQAMATSVETDAGHAWMEYRRQAKIWIAHVRANDGPTGQYATAFNEWYVIGNPGGAVTQTAIDAAAVLADEMEAAVLLEDADVVAYLSAPHAVNPPTDWVWKDRHPITPAGKWTYPDSWNFAVDNSHWNNHGDAFADLKRYLDVNLNIGTAAFTGSLDAMPAGKVAHFGTSFAGVPTWLQNLTQLQCVDILNQEYPGGITEINSAWSAMMGVTYNYATVSDAATAVYLVDVDENALPINNAFWKSDPDNPLIRYLWAKLIDVLTPLFRDHPKNSGLIRWGNEPQKQLNNDEWDAKGWTAHTRLRFAAWLQIRHADIAALNTQWGTSHADFTAAANAPAVPFLNADRGTQPYVDVIAFHDDNVTEWFTWAMDRFESHYADPADILFTSKLTSSTFTGQGNSGTMGINWWALSARANYVPGSDIKTTMTGGIGSMEPDIRDYNLTWEDKLTILMMGWSRGPFTNFNSEDHGNSSAGWRHPSQPAIYIKNMLLTGAAGGEMATRWAWGWSPDGSNFNGVLDNSVYGQAIMQPTVMWRTIKNQRIAQANSFAYHEILKACADSNLCIYWSQSSFVHSATYMTTFKKVAASLFPQGHNLRQVDGDMLTAMTPAEQDAITLVVPPTHYESDAGKAAIDAFSNGARLCVDVSSDMTLDEYGQSRVTSAIANATPLTIADPITLTAALAAVLPTAEIQALNPSGSPIYGMLVQTDRRNFVQITNQRNTVLTVNVKKGGVAVNGTDLINQQPLSAAIAIQPMDVVLLDLAGATPNTPPVAGFDFLANGLTVDFTSTATDSDGTVGAYYWSIDGTQVGTGATYQHVFPADATYVVSHYVTDDDGDASPSVSQNVTVTGAVAAAKLALNLPGTAYYDTGEWFHANFWKKCETWVDRRNTAEITFSGSGAGDAVINIGGTDYTVPVDAGWPTWVYPSAIAKGLYDAGITEIIPKDNLLWIHAPGSAITITSMPAGLTATVTRSGINFTVDRDGELLTNAGSLQCYSFWPNGTYNIIWTGTGTVTAGGGGVTTDASAANSMTITLSGSQTLADGVLTAPQTQVLFTVTGTPRGFVSSKVGDLVVGNIRQAAVNAAIEFNAGGGRFMDMLMTNRPDIGGFNSRPLPTSASYSSLRATLDYQQGRYLLVKGAAGAPYEDCVEFANVCAAQAPGWVPTFHLPFFTTALESASIRAIYDTFTGPIYIPVRSNEDWNSGTFSHARVNAQYANENVLSIAQQSLSDAANLLSDFATNSTKARPCFEWGRNQWSINYSGGSIESLISANYASSNTIFSRISTQPYVKYDDTKTNDYLFEQASPQPGSFYDPSPATNPIDITEAAAQEFVNISSRLGKTPDFYEGLNLHDATGLGAVHGFTLSLDPRYEAVHLISVNRYMTLLPSGSVGNLFNNCSNTMWGLRKHFAHTDPPQVLAMNSYAAQ